MAELRILPRDGRFREGEASEGNRLSADRIAALMDRKGRAFDGYHCKYFGCLFTLQINTFIPSEVTLYPCARQGTRDGNVGPGQGGEISQSLLDGCHGIRLEYAGSREDSGLRHSVISSVFLVCHHMVHIFCLKRNVSIVLHTFLRFQYNCQTATRHTHDGHILRGPKGFLHSR